MLEEYFIRPATVDRIRGSWLGDAIQKYVTWLARHAYSSRCVIRRVPLLLRFGEFARRRGAHGVEELHGQVDAFVASQLLLIALGLLPLGIQRRAPAPVPARA